MSDKIKSGKVVREQQGNLALPKQDADLTAIIIARIRERLETLQLTANAAGRRTTRVPAVIHDILLGRNKNPTINLLFEIANALETSVGYLIGETNSLTDINNFPPTRVRRFKAAGGVHSLARLLDIAHQAILQWDDIPAERLLEIEALTGMARERLRPDRPVKRAWRAGRAS